MPPSVPAPTASKSEPRPAGQAVEATSPVTRSRFRAPAAAPRCWLLLAPS